ncbi:hypothetical protein [Nostoc sp.]
MHKNYNRTYATGTIALGAASPHLRYQPGYPAFFTRGAIAYGGSWGASL